MVTPQIQTATPGGHGLNLLGGTPGNDTADTIENTYIASYYALASGTAARENLENMVRYIQYLMGETTFNPVENGQGLSWHPLTGDSTTLTVVL